MLTRYQYWFILGLIFLFVTACNSSEGEVRFSTATIAQATFAKDSSGVERTTVYDPEDTFYLLVDLANAPDGTAVKAEWTAVDVDGADPNTVLDNVELVSGSGDLTFDLVNDGSWPVGRYKVDLYLNGELDRTVDFMVSAGLAQVEEPTAVADPIAETGAVSGLENVKTAVIQIEAQGSFIDPEFGQVYNAAGRGSGFIISDSGLAVTNNHVVTGAALLKVWVGGESEPRNARVLGVSECADLAVIDIEGEGYPYLEWYEDSIDVGLDVYAAGFPLGDPEYTLTRGIVSKANANGDTDWASVDAVIEHDATINPGNSGGALVSPDGHVVAVNYAGASSVNQYFAIGQAEALAVIEQLIQEIDYLSIGINGRAVNNGEGISGVWVSSVKSGSPADRAGIQAGDILTQLEGLVLGVDGTLADYCDILRTHTPEDTLSIEVLRFASEEVLTGQLNGRQLEQSFSFAQELAEETTHTTTENTAGNANYYTRYNVVTDNSGQLSVEIPAEWGDVSGDPWMLEDEQLGFAVVAAPSLDAYYNTWSTPGVFFGATDQLNLSITELLDAYNFSEWCTYDARYEYADAVYTGAYDLWTNCGGGESIYVVLSSMPEDGSYIVLVTVLAITEADLEALDYILNSFVVIN